MIVADRKPIEEIIEEVKDYEKILILGCNECVTVCEAGWTPVFWGLLKNEVCGRNGARPVDSAFWRVLEESVRSPAVRSGFLMVRAVVPLKANAKLIKKLTAPGN